MRVNAILLLVSLAFSLAAAEIVARAVVTAPPAFGHPQVRFRSDPVLGFAFAPDQRAFAGEAAVTINTRGLRGAVVPYDRSAGTTRILFLGDSITFGYGVAEDAIVSNRVSALLSEKGQPAEAVNAGVLSYNTEQAVRFLETEGMRYRSDWVVVGLYWNDLRDEFRNRITASGWLVAGEASPLDSPDPITESPWGRALRNRLKRSRLLFSVVQGLRNLRAAAHPDQLRAAVLEGHETPETAAGWTRIEAALRRVPPLARAHGFQVLVVAYPTAVALARTFPHSDYPRRAREIAERLALPFLDLTGAFEVHWQGHDSLFVPYDADHPNARGHAIAAGEIATHILPTPPGPAG